MIDHVRGGESRQPVAHPSWSGAITGAAIAAALVAGFLAAVAELVAVAVAAGVGLFGLVAWRPVLATYLYPGDAALHRWHRARHLGPAVATQRGATGSPHGRRDGGRLCPGCERRAAAASPPPVRRTARRVRPARHRLADQFDVVAGRASGRGGRRCSAPGVQAGRAPPAGAHHGAHPDAGALVHPADHWRGGRHRHGGHSPDLEHRTGAGSARHLVADRPGRVLGRARHGDALERRPQATS